jgi:hypothetical protein
MYDDDPTIWELVKSVLGLFALAIFIGGLFWLHDQQ